MRPMSIFVLIVVLLLGGRNSVSAREGMMLAGEDGAGPDQISQSEASGERFWSSYTTVSETRSLLVDERRNAIWAGTRGGILRWDRSSETYTVYTTLDGLPSNIITAIHQDKGGDLIFGSLAGLIFHSISGDWRVLNQADGRPIGIVHDIARDSAGALWVGTQDGLLHQSSDGQWRWVPSGPGLPAGSVFSVEADLDGGLWIAIHQEFEGRGLSRRDAEGRWRHYSSMDGLVSDKVNDILVDGAGHRYFGTDQGLSRLSADDEWTSFTLAEGLPNAYVAEMGLVPATEAPQGVGALEVDVPVTELESAWGESAEGAEEEIWIATQNGVVRLHADDRFTRLDSLMGQTLFSAYSITGDKDGHLFIGLSDGFYMRDDDGRWQAYQVDSVLSQSQIDAAKVDAEGDVFFASRFGLLRHTAEGAWNHLLPGQNGLSNGEIQSLALDGEGRAMVSSGPVIHRWMGDAEGWRKTRLIADQAIFILTDLIEDEEGRLYAGVWLNDSDTAFPEPSGLLIREPDTSWSRIDKDAGLPDDHVTATAIDASGRLWVGTINGLSMRDASGQWLIEAGLSGSWVTQILATEQGRLWIGTRSGLFLREEGAQLRAVEGSESHLSGQHISALELDAEGGLWIGTSGAGVFHLDALLQASDHFKLADGLVDLNITDIVIDAEGEVWASSIAGISRRVQRERGDCENAYLLEGERGVGASLQDESIRHFYAFEAEEAFSRVEIGIADPEDHLEVYLFRSCQAAGTPSGRPIGTPSGRPIDGEQRLRYDIGAQTGRYIVMVQAKEGAAADGASFPFDYRIRLNLHVVDPDASRLLILTHEPRLRSLSGDPAAVDDLMRSVDALAREASGVVIRNIQNDTDAETRAAYAAYLAQPHSIAAANAVADALGDWVRQRQQLDLPRLHYVLLIGDDRIIPHRRLAVVPEYSDPQWVSEADYLEQSGIDPSSGIGAAIAAGDFVLSDAAYAVPRDISWGSIAADPAGLTLGRSLELPSLALGRLVEEPAEMQSVIDAYLNNKVIEVRRSLMAGWDFMHDGTQQGDALLAKAGLPASQRALLDGDGWTAQELRSLFEAGPDLVFLAAHADHAGYQTPDRGRIEALEIESLSPRSSKSGHLTYALACHGGLNVPGKNHSHPLDLPEAWQAAGSHLIGSTGWAYGMSHLLGYQETLMVELTRILAEESDQAGAANTGSEKVEGIAIGDALLRAQHRYLAQNALDHYHAKTVAGTLLYGLPMTRIALRATEETPFAAGAKAGDPKKSALRELDLNNPDAFASDSEVAASAKSRVSKGRIGRGTRSQKSNSSLLDPKPLDLTQAMADENLPKFIQRIEFSEQGYMRHSTPDGDYYAYGSGRPEANSGEIVQPRLQSLWGEQRLDGRRLVPRGVWLRSAAYRSETDFNPLWAKAGILSRLALDGFPSQHSSSNFKALAQSNADSDPNPNPDSNSDADTDTDTDAGLQPALPFRLRLGVERFQDPEIMSDSSLASLDIFLGQFDPATKTERLMRDIEFEAVYADADGRQALDDSDDPNLSHAALGAGPQILEVDWPLDGAGASEVRVRVEAQTGISRVGLACDDGAGRWSSLELSLSSGADPALDAGLDRDRDRDRDASNRSSRFTPRSGLTPDSVSELWTGRAPADAACFVQAQDAQGRTSFDARAGRLYRSGESGGRGYRLLLPWLWN